MALFIRKHPLHRRGRSLDAGRVLYVTRRVPLGPDAKGEMQYLTPGVVFDASKVSPLRLQTLFRSRFIGHEPPAFVAPAPTGPKPSAPVEAPSAPRPAKPPRPAARS